MRTVLRPLGRTLPAMSAVLILAACGSTPSPTAVDGAVRGGGTAVQPPATVATMTIRGVVVDSSNRPLANAGVECMGDVRCRAAGSQVSAEDGPDDGLKTDSSGSYQLVVTGGSGSVQRGFLMNAHARSYEVAWREVRFPDPGCTSDQAGCTVSINFTLDPMAD